MMQRWTLYIAIGVWLVILAVVKFAVTPPMPASVQMIYMTLSTIGIVLFVTANEARFQAFLAPLKAVFEGRVPKVVQALVLAGIPLLAGWGAWLRTAPSWDAPFEPRVVHPEPPSSFSLHGNRIETATLKNPLRTAHEKNPAELEKLTQEGKTIYYQNCFFCHGDALAGDGHFANAFSPIPANFRDVGTISMLQESFVFWRVSTGGPGLPKGATPWLSAMPVWQNFLSEDEMWKAILYIYAGSGSTPRTWDEEGGHAKH